MNRWDWMAVKAYAPAALALIVGFGLTWLIAGWQDNPFLHALVGPARWLPLGLLIYAVGHACWVGYRLWLAERGEGLLCDCGGLLGAERDGRYGPYRRCLACSRNVARRHYE